MDDDYALSIVIPAYNEVESLPVLVAEDPLTCVVRGCGMALERMERLGSIFTSE